MTSPLVPPEVDLRGMPFMPLQTVRLLDSDFWSLTSPEEFKAGLALWCKSWQQVPAASVPNNDRVLADLSRTGSRWKKVKTMALHNWILCDDDRWYHPVVAEQALKAWSYRQSQSKRAASRWSGEGDAGAHATAMPRHSPGSAQAMPKEVKGSRSKGILNSELPELPRARDVEAVDNSHAATAQPPPTSDRKIHKINGQHRRDDQAWMKSDEQAKVAGARFDVERRQGEPLTDFVDRIVNAMRAAKRATHRRNAG